MCWFRDGNVRDRLLCIGVYYCRISSSRIYLQRWVSIKKTARSNTACIAMFKTRRIVNVAHLDTFWLDHTNAFLDHLPIETKIKVGCALYLRFKLALEDDGDVISAPIIVWLLLGVVLPSICAMIHCCREYAEGGYRERRNQTHPLIGADQPPQIPWIHSPNNHQGESEMESPFLEPKWVQFLSGRK